MKDSKNIFNYAGQVFATFGVIVTILILLGKLVGEEAEGYCSLFEMGNDGFSSSTLMQLLGFSIIITCTQIIFMTDRWIKNMPLIARSICFIGLIFIAAVCFICIFSWFQITDGKAWVGFVVSFVLCTAAGILIGTLKENAENRKMEEALAKINRE